HGSHGDQALVRGGCARTSGFRAERSSPGGQRAGASAYANCSCIVLGMECRCGDEAEVAAAGLTLLLVDQSTGVHNPLELATASVISPQVLTSLLHRRRKLLRCSMPSPAASG